MESDILKLILGSVLTLAISLLAYFAKKYLDNIEAKLKSLSVELNNAEYKNEENRKELAEKVDTLSKSLLDKISTLEKLTTKIDTATEINFQSIKESIYELKEVKPKQDIKKNFGKVTIRDE